MRYKRSGSFVGRRIEIGPHLDLWMRGARFGVVVMQSTAHEPGELMRLKVRMDHPQVKRLAVLHVSDVFKFMDEPTGLPGEVLSHPPARHPIEGGSLFKGKAE